MDDGIDIDSLPRRRVRRRRVRRRRVLDENQRRRINPPKKLVHEKPNPNGRIQQRSQRGAGYSRVNAPFGWEENVGDGIDLADLPGAIGRGRVGNTGLVKPRDVADARVLHPYLRQIFNINRQAPEPFKSNRQAPVPRREKKPSEQLEESFAPIAFGLATILILFLLPEIIFTVLALKFLLWFIDLID